MSKPSPAAAVAPAVAAAVREVAGKGGESDV